MTASSAKQVHLTWADLTVKIRGHHDQPRFLLKNVNGYAEPGNLDCIMGPSGSGKTTLMNALAGRLDRASVQTGEILANGRKQKLAYGNSAYVTQDDILIPALTVKETILYSAHLQLPNKMSNIEKNERVESVIKELGLQGCVNSKIGGWPVRGLSGGERKRVSIAIQVLKHPQLLFLDEPTSGLDSAAAYHIVMKLRAMAQAGKTVLVAIHQPSAEAFACFDHLTLLSSGRTVYFGEAAEAQQFFEDAGFPCPSFRNPSDHFLWIINSDFDEIRHDDVEIGEASTRLGKLEKTELLCSTYSNSGIQKIVNVHIQEATCKKGNLLGGTEDEATSFFTQTFYLTLRSFTNMRRNLAYYWFRLLANMTLAICVSTIFYDVGLTYPSIQARAGMLMFVTSFVTFLGIVTFPAIMEDMKVFTQERLNGHYGVASFIISNGLSSFPFLCLLSLLPGVILYFVSGLHPGFNHFLFFVLTLLACLSIVESLLMAIATIVSNFLTGLIFGSGLMGIFLLTGGFFRSMNELPKVIWRYPLSYMSFHTWANRALYNNDFQGLIFKCNVIGLPPLLFGDQILHDLYQLDIPYSKWWALLVLVAMSFSYRLIFVAILKVKETWPYMIQQQKTSYMTKRTMSSRFVVSLDNMDNL